MKVELWAIVAEMDKPGHWNIVGLKRGPGLELPLVSSRKEIIDNAWGLVDPVIKKKNNARIVRLVEVEE